jgi:hypothetical protein
MAATTRRTRTAKQTLPPDAPVEALTKRTLPVELTPEVLADLRRPFTAAAVKFKPQAVSKDGTKALATFYVDARLVGERLNYVVGAAAWTPAYRPIMAETNAQAWMAAFFPVECTLTVLGVAKADVGVYTNGSKPDDKAVKSAYSDALKRAGVQFGIGAYLYALPKQWFPFKQGPNGKGGQFANEAAIRTAYGKMIEAFGSPIDHGDLSDPETADGAHEEPTPAAEPKAEPKPTGERMAEKEDVEGMVALAESVGIPKADVVKVCKEEHSAHGGYRYSWLVEQLQVLNDRAKQVASGEPQA